VAAWNQDEDRCEGDSDGEAAHEGAPSGAVRWTCPAIERTAGSRKGRAKVRQGLDEKAEPLHGVSALSYFSFMGRSSSAAPLAV
jgi:hypothetical protein